MLYFMSIMSKQDRKPKRSLLSTVTPVPRGEKRGDTTNLPRELKPAVSSLPTVKKAGIDGR